jgi:hypothetical protein
MLGLVPSIQFFAIAEPRDDREERANTQLGAANSWMVGPCLRRGKLHPTVTA